MKTVLDEDIQQYPIKASQGKPAQVQEQLIALVFNCLSAAICL